MIPDTKWTVSMDKYTPPADWLVQRWLKEFGVETSTPLAAIKAIQEAAEWGYRQCQSHHESSDDAF